MLGSKHRPTRFAIRRREPMTARNKKKQGGRRHCWWRSSGENLDRAMLARNGARDVDTGRFWRDFGEILERLYVLRCREMEATNRAKWSSDKSKWSSDKSCENRLGAGSYGNDEKGAHSKQTTGSGGADEDSPAGGSMRLAWATTMCNVQANNGPAAASHLI